ncbi:MAG: CPXCG motif-containing cysteine-rich protein [Gammaproteobacteria bacterium]|nr:CPXCG motif-containing cysteine-rich protein [Gammaproteobacteria bacterium]
MNTWEEYATACPYCNAPITLLLDCSEAYQEYIEDCEVCCQPITVHLRISGDLENDVIQVELSQDHYSE